MKNHLLIIITIVIGFSSFMMGYSLPPFMEVGFGQEETAEGGADNESDLQKQYEELYENAEQEGGS